MRLRVYGFTLLAVHLQGKGCPMKLVRSYCSRRATVSACAFGFAFAMLSSAYAADGDIPKKYAGSWRGLMADMSGSSESKPRPLVTITKDVGHKAGKFSFEVAPDGAISGSGSATLRTACWRP